MTETPTISPKPRLVPRLGSAMGITVGIVAGAIAACVITLFVVHVERASPSRFWSSLFGEGRSTTIASQASVVERIQSLQRMETVVFNMDKIVTGEKGSPFLP